MSDCENDPADNKIHAKLQTVAEAMTTPPPWYDAWAKLTSASPDEERLAVYQAIRRSGTLPHEASFFLVSTLIDDIALRDADDALHDYESRMKAIEKQYRLGEGGIWPSGTAPAGYDELREKYYQAWGELFAKNLEQYGEREMAHLFRDDEERFNQLTDAGRQYFFGAESDAESMPLVWLHRLVEAVAGCMEAGSPMGPLGYRYGEDDGMWQIDLYPTPVELIGGAADGEVMAPGFCLTSNSYAACSTGSTPWPGSRWGSLAVRGRMFRSRASIRGTKSSFRFLPMHQRMRSRG